jgi:hypothetical protein
MRAFRGPNIHVYIEQLILEGLPVDRIQAPRIQIAVEAELMRLLLDGGLSADLQAGGALPGIRVDAIQLPTGNNPTQIGTQIARSIYSGIGNKR